MYWISDNEGWICSGLKGEIYHTTDGGQTFTTQTTQYYTNAIWMLNANEGYAGGYNGRVYRTTNGGGAWNVIGSMGSSVRSISFPPSSDTGYCCGDNGGISRINSTGVSSMESGVVGNLRSISFPSTSLGWICGNGLLLNYNATWEQQYPPLEGYNGIYMNNNTTGWVAGSGGVIVNTTNGGNDWNYQSNPDVLNRDLNDIFFLNVSEGWAVGNSGVILHTTNGGTSWTIEGAGLTTNMLRAVQYTSSSNGYILGNNGTLLKYTQLTGIETAEGQNRSSKLMQNKPNPFQSTTSLKYTLHQPGHVNLAVYNLQGEMICRLVNEYQTTGEHSVMFDGSGLPAGIYYYRIIATDISETGKMMLFK